MNLRDGVPGVNGPDPTSYEEFWPYYLSQHLHPVTRAVHAVSTTAALTVGAIGILGRRPKLIAASPVVGYGGAWLSHFLVEKNKPASFGSPLWSVRGDFRLLRKFYARTLDADVAEVRAALDLAPGAQTLADDAEVRRAA